MCCAALISALWRIPPGAACSTSPQPGGPNFYITKAEAPSILTMRAYSSAYVVQDFDGKELNAPSRAVPNAAYQMVPSEAGKGGSSFDIWVGSSNIIAGASIIHTIPVLFDFAGRLPPSPLPPPPPSPPPTPPPPSPSPPSPPPAPPAPPPPGNCILEATQRRPSVLGVTAARL